MLALVAAILPLRALALDPERSLDQLRHTGWTLRDGAPGNIRALAQSKDGFLWLGGATGLYRFDGVRFERIVPDDDEPGRSLQVTALLADRNGDIWVGYDFGGIAIYRGGHLRAANPWPPEGGIGSIVQARDGSVWVATEVRGRMHLARHRNGRWTRFGAGQGLADGLMGPVFAAENGAVIVAAPPALLRMAPNGSRFAPLPATGASFAALAQGSKGGIWLADDMGLRPLGSQGARKRLAPVGTPYVTRHMAIDRDGGIWITGQDDGLVRFRRVEGALVGETASGLTARLSLSVLEDREGNVWVGTASGLDRFAPSSMVAMTGATQPVTGFVSAPDSPHVFFAGLGGVYRASHADPEPQLVFPKAEIGVLCGNPRRMMAISLQGAFLIELDKQGTLTRSSRVEGPLSVSCALDARGRFWTGMDRLYRVEGGRLAAAGKPGGTFTLLRPDAAGGLIAARSRSGVLAIDGNRTRVRLPSASLTIGAVTTLMQDRARLLAGGQKGLALIDGDMVMQLSERRFPFLAGITGIARTTDGWTWLIGATGIVRVRNDALERAFRFPSAPLPVQRIGQEGDYRARSNLFEANDIARDATGTLWFATDRGVAWVDPARLSRNALVPPVAIMSLQADGRTRALSRGAIRLPPNVGRVEIAYTALSLTDSEANRFRYRLNGTGDWYDAGHERRALFTNLGPGRYEFQVIAANNAGVWNRDGASVRFTVAPAFYQARWFLALCFVVIGGIGWLLYRRRLHAIAERARSRVEAQLAERERIARELHDTLLQGFQGLMLRFQAVVELIPRGERARQEMEGALDRAEGVLIESRERVHSMRQDLLPVELADRLSALADDVLPATIAWDVQTMGTPRLVCAPVADEIASIVREALSNSVRHAQAHSIAIIVGHGSDRLSVTVRDDGIGLPAAVREAGGREGHYGLVGMRERVRRLSGTMEFTAPADGGTELRLTIPARIAYESA